MAELVELTVDFDAAEKIAKRFNAAPKQISRASKRAMTKTVKKKQIEITRQIARQEQVPVRVVRKFRSRKNVSKKGKVGRIWFGFNPIKARFLGRISGRRKNATPKAGKHEFPKAFIRKMDSGFESIFKRANTLTGHSKGRPTNWTPNLPIEEQTIKPKTFQSVVASQRGDTNALYLNIFEKELNFEVNIRGNR